MSIFPTPGTPRNPRWQPRWLPKPLYGYISETKPPRLMILVSRVGFSGARNSFLTTKVLCGGHLINNSRWLPRWPPDYSDGYISGTKPPRLIILVSSMGFSGARNAFITTKV